MLFLDQLFRTETWTKKAGVGKDLFFLKVKGLAEILSQQDNFTAMIFRLPRIN